MSETSSIEHVLFKLGLLSQVLFSPSFLFNLVCARTDLFFFHAFHRILLHFYQISVHVLQKHVSFSVAEEVLVVLGDVVRFPLLAIRQRRFFAEDVFTYLPST